MTQRYRIGCRVTRSAAARHLRHVRRKAAHSQHRARPIEFWERHLEIDLVQQINSIIYSNFFRYESFQKTLRLRVSIYNFEYRFTSKVIERDSNLRSNRELVIFYSWDNRQTICSSRYRLYRNITDEKKSSFYPNRTLNNLVISLPIYVLIDETTTPERLERPPQEEKWFKIYFK